jgi:hypothetical protein
MLASDTSNTPITDNTPVTITAHERLTWDEICQRYPDTWVVAVSPKRADETDEADDVTIEFAQQWSSLITRIAGASFRSSRRSSTVTKSLVRTLRGDSYRRPTNW